MSTSHSNTRASDLSKARSESGMRFTLFDSDGDNSKHAGVSQRPER